MRLIARLIPALAGLLVAAGVCAGPVETAGAPAAEPARLYARSAILVDQATGRVLYQRNADEPLVPASLAKLMSLHIVYERLEDRSINRTDVVSLTANAWADNQAPGSTLMHLGKGQIVTVEELMRGAAIASGNDAAAALAEYVAGSTAEFVRRMNEEARFMGYAVTRFTDPSGIGEGNQVTAREFADFCRRYIDLHPEALAELHSLREIAYPLPKNMPGGRLGPNATKKQFNGNFLVWDDFGVDGLKTGHLDDDNFTAAITARRGETRLIAVLLGVPGTSLSDGASNRSEDGMALLSYGFRNYSTLTLEPPELAPARVWKGTARAIPVAAAATVRLTVRHEEVDRLAYSVRMEEPLLAPVARGQKVGTLVYTAGGDEVGWIPLVAAEGVDTAGFIRRAWDTIALALAAVRDVLDTLLTPAIVSQRTLPSIERRAP